MTKPHLFNLAAEAAVLGAVLFENAEYERLSAILRAEHFSAPAHQLLWRRMGALIETGQTADGMTLDAFARETPEIRDVGGGKYLFDLLDSAPLGDEAKHYARMIADYAARRTLASALDEMREDVERPGTGASAIAIVETLRSRLNEAESVIGFDEASIESAADVIDDILSEMETAQKTGKRLPDGISTGSGKLDNLIGRMHAGDLIVLAGRPAMGKTALAMNIAMNAKARDDKGFPVPARAVVLSLEMDRRQLAYRASSSAARRQGMGHIAYRRAREGKLGQNEIATLRAAWKKIPTSIVWETRGRLTWDEVRAAIKAARRKLGGLDIAVIDYLQIMNIRQERGQTRTDAIGEITASLKALAKEMGIAIVLLSQLSRKVEERDDKRPMMADLRDSGSIEQDADVILMVYREEYYLDQSKPQQGAAQDKKNKWEAAMAEAIDKVDVIAAKVRNGATGFSRLHFERDTDTIVDEKEDLYVEAIV